MKAKIVKILKFVSVVVVLPDQTECHIYRFDKSEENRALMIADNLNKTFKLASANDRCGICGVIGCPSDCQIKD